MTRYKDDTQYYDSAIGVWDNEGGASGRIHLDDQFGCRIEADQSWTIYHVFTGVPASRKGQEMTGLSYSVATDGMLSLNRRNEERRKRHTNGLLRVPHIVRTAEADRR